MRSDLARAAMATCAFVYTAFVATATSLPAQAVTHHPQIHGASPTTPLPGQTVTITGTDLAPPTWTIELTMEEKYGPNVTRLNITGTSTALTFTAPSSLRPDSIFIQYKNASVIDANNNPIPITERLKFIPSIFVQRPPVIDTTSFISVPNSGGGSFKVLPPGSTTLKGRDLLAPPSGTVTTNLRSVTGNVGQITGIAGGTTLTLTTAPTVTLAATGVGVSSSRYLKHVRDEVVVTAPSLANNTTGFVKVTTPAGSDSVRVSIARAPADARVFDNLGFSATSPLVRGRQYSIRGQNLVLHQQVSSNTFTTGLPTVQVGSVSLNLFNTVSGSDLTTDTLVFFTIPATANPVTGGTLSLSHAGGSISLGSFTVINPPAPLSITGAVISPNDIIGGTAATMTISLNPTPTNFTTAGQLVVTIPTSLASAIPPIAPISITSNPMTFSVPTRSVPATISGSVTVSHNVTGGGSASVALSVRPPRPTAVVVAPDTVPGSRSAAGSVSFDLAGPATVLLSSSDPSVASVPQSVVRSGSTANFTIATQLVTKPHPVTITAALNGVTVSKAIVVAPGRLASVTMSPTTVFAGEPVTATLAFDVAVSNASVTLASSDTALRASGSTTATGTSRVISFSTTKSLVAPVTATFTATLNGISKSATVQINPIQITQFTVSPTSGVGGATLAATLRLSRTALQQQILTLTSSDTTVATVPSFIGVSIGEDVKVVTITLRGPQSSSRTASITAALRVTNNIGAPIINSKSATVTSTP